MAILTGKGALTAVADTVINNTARARWIRLRLYNTGSSTRVVTIENGTTRLAQVTLDNTEDGRQRDVGPYAFANGDNLEAWQDAGTDVHYSIHGEDES